LGLGAWLLVAVVLLVLGILTATVSGCTPTTGQPQFAVHEVGGEGFVEGAAWGQPFVFEVRASGIEQDGELVDCVVVILQWVPYLDVAGVPYDAPQACVDEYGALPGFFRASPDATGLNSSTTTDTD